MLSYKDKQMLLRSGHYNWKPPPVNYMNFSHSRKTGEPEMIYWIDKYDGWMDGKPKTN